MSRSYAVRTLQEFGGKRHHTIVADDTNTIDEVKDIIAAELGLAPGQVRAFVWAGKDLDGSRTLGDYLTLGCNTIYPLDVLVRTPSPAVSASAATEERLPEAALIGEEVNPLDAAADDP